MNNTLSRAHTFTTLPPGHVDGPNACTECGHGPLAPQHTGRGADLYFAALDAAPTNVAVARQVAETWLAGLDQMSGNAAFGAAALRAVLAALDGETDLARLGLHGMRGTLTPRTGEGQPPLPLAS